MNEKKRFLLRIDHKLFAALELWAADELRSVNAQIEYLLNDATRKAGRCKTLAKEQTKQTMQDDESAGE